MVGGRIAGGLKRGPVQFGHGEMPCVLMGLVAGCCEGLTAVEAVQLQELNDEEVLAECLAQTPHRGPAARVP